MASSLKGTAKQKEQNKQAVPFKTLDHLLQEIERRGWDAKTIEHIRLCLISQGYNVRER